MNPEQLRLHALSEIDRFESLLELLRGQPAVPCKEVLDRLVRVAHRAALAAEPLTDEEVSDGSPAGQLG